jgi:hypothetical protein
MPELSSGIAPITEVVKGSLQSPLNKELCNNAYYDIIGSHHINHCNQILAVMNYGVNLMSGFRASIFNFGTKKCAFNMCFFISIVEY